MHSKFGIIDSNFVHSGNSRVFKLDSEITRVVERMVLKVRGGKRRSTTAPIE